MQLRLRKKWLPVGTGPGWNKYSFHGDGSSGLVRSNVRIQPLPEAVGCNERLGGDLPKIDIKTIAPHVVRELNLAVGNSFRLQDVHPHDSLEFLGRF